jgi:hypothetical protein
MRLFTGKDDKMLEFTMQCRGLVRSRNVSGILNVRSDYGHGLYKAKYILMVK